MAHVVSEFNKTLENFKKTAGLSPDELLSFQLTSLDDLKRQISVIQDDQRKSKRQQYLKRLEPFLDTMEQYGKIIEVFLNVSDIVAFIWGPMKFLLMVARNCANAFDALLQMYLEIGESIPQFIQYQTLFQDNDHMKLALAHIYRDILEFHKEALRYFRQRTWKQLFDATWRSFSNKVSHLEQNLRRHKTLIERQASIIEYEKLQDLYAQSLRHFEDCRQSELDRKRQSIQSWLGAVDAQVRHQDAAEDRHGNSGEWIFQDPIFKKWYDLDACWEPLLWLSGIPGAGKTVLASRIIDACRTQAKMRLGFFYCRHTDGDRDAFACVVRTIISQLVVGNDLLLDLVHSYMMKSTETVLSSNSTAKAILETVLQTGSITQKTYIVIDGLDEYGRGVRKDIATWFKKQVHDVPKNDLGQLRCLFISQDDGYARKDFSDCSSVTLTANNTQADIEEFCQFWYGEIEKRFGPLDPMEQNLSRLVTARAQGMFLYAKLVMWNLHEQPTKKLFKTEMRPETFPEGLEQAYDRIINRIIGPSIRPKARSDNARRLLGWLVCAKRALYWREIQGAMSIDLEEGILCPDLQFKDDYKDLGASLVKRTCDGSVVLVHSTARKYLIDNGHVHTPEVEFDMALRCLAYMSFELFCDSVEEDKVHTALYNGDFVFIDYASGFWAYHLIESLRAIQEMPSYKLEDINEAISALLDTQWASPKTTLVVSPTLTKALSALSSHGSYEKICQAVVSAKNQLLPTGKGPSDDEPLHIAKVVKLVRTKLESLISSLTVTGDQKALLNKFYGPGLFKCYRINCQFYWKGFATQSMRDHHVSKHERAFTCTEEGCSRGIIGCITAQDLRKHMEKYHGIVTNVEPEFPDDELELDPGPELTQKNRGLFACTLCHKRFTRTFNLRAHIRTHTDEKPFACSFCNLSFVRKADCQRHKMTHAEGKGYICRGDLKNGAQWGCGRKYDRIDALGRHFKSEVGRACRRPLLEEAQQQEILEQAQLETETPTVTPMQPIQDSPSIHQRIRDHPFPFEPRPQIFRDPHNYWKLDKMTREGLDGLDDYPRNAPRQDL